MSLDTEYLRSIRVRAKFRERVGSTPLYLFEEPTQRIIKLMSRYFKTFKECTVIDRDDFLVWVNEVKGDNMLESDKVLQNTLLADFDCPMSESAEQFLTERLQESDLVYKASDVITRWASGDEIEVIEQLKVIADKAAFGREDRDGIKTVTMSTNDILATSGTNFGFEWGLPLLSKAMRPLQAGDMVLIAARPDSGKTTFLGDIIRPFSKQVDELYPDENRCILWLNNEGPGNRIKLRSVQSALQLTIGELSQLANNGEDLDELYTKALGCESKVVILDIHGKNTAQVERKIEEYNPAVIVWDMLDHVKYVSEDMSRQARTDEYLEGLYKWVREIGVRYECVNLVSTQLSGDAENIQYPALGMLKDSKTGKQGQADAIITFGMVQTYPNTRFIGLTKNKLNMGSSTGRLGEVLFDGARGVISMPSEE